MLTYKWAYCSTGPPRGPWREEDTNSVDTSHTELSPKKISPATACPHALCCQAPAHKAPRWFSLLLNSLSPPRILVSLLLPKLTLNFSPDHLLFLYFHNSLSLFSHFYNFVHDFLKFFMWVGMCIQVSYIHTVQRSNLNKCILWYKYTHTPSSLCLFFLQLLADGCCLTQWGLAGTLG